MLLEDATSKEEVEQVLAGDRGEDEANELRNDIESELLDAKRGWEHHYSNYFEYDDFDVRDFAHESSEFLDEIIKQSPSDYDLAGIDRDEIREDVDRHLRGSRRHSIFQWGTGRDVDTSGFSFTTKIGGSVHFPESRLPVNAEFIPAEMAQEFWDDIAQEYGIHGWSNGTDEVTENTGYMQNAEDITIGVAASAWQEFCRDILADQINTLAESDPKGVADRFMRALSYSDHDLWKALKDANPPQEDLVSLAVLWFSGEEYEAKERAREYIEALDMPQEQVEREVVLDIDEAALREMGITSGALWEERPWKLIKLETYDLPAEGLAMRHCVGTKGMGYMQAVKDGEIEIWSLRSRANKARFTLEVDQKFYDADEDTAAEEARAGREMTHFTAERQRGEAIKQLKGKANRLPGYAEAYGRSGVVKFPDEVTLWAWIFDQLDVDASTVADFKAFRDIVTPEKPPPTPNMGEACVGFDLPYRPLRRPGGARGRR